MPEPSASVPELPEEIRQRVQLELLIQKAVEDARGRTGKRDSLLRHPAALVVLTFLLTGAIGSMLTSLWQTRQWRREQTYAAAQDLTGERVAVMNLTTEAIAESFTAAEDVLHLVAWNWSPGSPVLSLKERSAAWIAASRQWRVQEKVLLARVDATFDGARPNVVLHRIIDRRQYLGNDIQNLLALADQVAATGKVTPEQEATIEKHRNNALLLIHETTGTGGLLSQLTSAMVAQIRPEKPQRVE
jgi:hypothetical protein